MMPFLALRSYLPAGHESKGDEIGSEKNPAEFIDMLLGLTAEWGRVLASHGSIAIELGDTYSGSGGGGGDYLPGGLRENQPGFGGSAERQRDGNAAHWRAKNQTPGAWPRAKCLALIPQLYAVALAYGINPLTGQPSPAGRWLVRNVVVWHRPNPAVGALGDKVRPSTSYIVIATRSAKRWFDLSAVRSDALRPTLAAKPSIPNAQEVPTTLLAGTFLAARGWCQPGRSKLSVGPSVTWHTKRLEVVEPVGFLVGVETSEGAKMMDLELLGCPADPTLVVVTAKSILSGDGPVSAAVIGAATLPTGMVLASDIDGPPLARTLEAAEIVSQRLASVAGKWLVAEITLRFDGTDATACAIAPIGSAVSHSREFSSNHADQASLSTAGAPPLDTWFDQYDGTHDTWTLTTQPSPLCHYAMWPSKLAERLILMMCPREVCRVCGEARRRVEGKAEYVRTDSDVVPARLAQSNGYRIAEGINQHHNDDGANTSVTRNAPTLGWTDCGHDDYRPGLVLDPFCGSGTTCAVADLHGRDAIGIDIDARNQAIYPRRYDEVKRALFGTPIPDPAQGVLL